MLFGQRTVYECYKTKQIPHITAYFHIKTLQNYTPQFLLYTPTAHILGVTIICCSYCFHNLWLKVNCIPNFLLAQIFEGGLNVIDESTICPPRWFPFINVSYNPPKWFCKSVGVYIIVLKVVF